jgi:succinate-semialdehyde dehydrogenase/glutarate-semialdehyde dehydrogenase
MTSTTTPALPRALADQVPTGLLVDGAWRPAASGATFAVDDPATGGTIAEVADAGPQDGLDALGAAHAAGPAWRDVAPRERAELLRAVFETLVARTEDFAALITAEGGKPIAESRAEVAYAADYVRWFSEQAVRVNGMTRTAPSGANRQLVLRRPVGPALLITPWNFPIAMITRKVAPALAAGCTVVVKPAELTPLTTALFAEVVRAELESRGLPTGVVNVVPTSSAAALTEPVLADPRLRKLSFTGSTEVGRELLKTAADTVVSASMELGGNAPLIVLPGADLDLAVEGALLAKMRNGGSACTSANRFYVHSSVHDDFVARFSAKLSAMKVGSGLDHDNDLGALVSLTERDKVADLVSTAVSAGATVVTGGTSSEKGAFYAPTLLTGVQHGSAINTTEIFGPVTAVVKFEDVDEAVRQANDTIYGLMAYVFGEEREAMNVALRLQSGMVAVNRGVVSDPAAPFGGMKQSGLGREGSTEGVLEFLEEKYIAVSA